MHSIVASGLSRSLDHARHKNPRYATSMRVCEYGIILMPVFFSLSRMKKGNGPFSAPQKLFKFQLVCGVIMHSLLRPAIILSSHPTLSGLAIALIRLFNVAKV